MGNGKRARIILITSCKGGVGKSTVSANLGMALARLGKRVLLVDCDFGIRCLDVIMGLTDMTLYDVSDFVTHRAPIEKCAVKVKGCELSLIAAPYNIGYRSLNRFEFRQTVTDTAESGEYDFILLDTPGGFGESLSMSAFTADSALIVVSPDMTAIRAAEKTADFLEDNGVVTRRLIINKLTGRSIRKAKKDVLSLIESTHVRLLGVVPYESELIEAGNEGRMIDTVESVSCTQSFYNIAGRICGERIPLFSGVKKLRRL